MKITLLSKAGYTSWAWIDALKLLVDAGENIHNTLEGRVLNIRDVLLTHAHTDHFAGLLSIVGRRSALTLDPNHTLPPLRIIYPQNSETFRLFFEFFQAHLGSHFEQHLTLHPITQHSDPIPLLLREDMRVCPVLAHHRTDELCLSYRIEQARTRLRPEWASLPKDELRTRIQRDGRDAYSHTVHVPILWFSGDTSPHPDPHAQDTQLLVHEATFLAPDYGAGHSSLQDALEIFRTLSPRWMILNHLSTRYSPTLYRDALERHTTPQERERIHLVLPDVLTHLNLPVSGL